MKNILDYNLSEEQEEVLLSRLNIKGVKHQKIKCIEELSELVKEICKDIINADSFSIEKTSDEFADALLMLHQLENVYEGKYTEFKKLVNKSINFKLDRLKERNKKYA